MGLEPALLPELQRVVEGSRPLKPSQAAELHDIVTHVYLAGERDDHGALPGGFLGLSWAGARNSTWYDPPGLIVAQRIKGFVAYRFLREGDVLIGIAELPDRAFTAVQDLSAALAELGGGSRVTLIILRGGRMVRVPLRLDARPNWPAGVDQIQALRENKAEQYWEANFSKYVARPMTSAGN
jgi:hypothetical protein